MTGGPRPANADTRYGSAGGKASIVLCSEHKNDLQPLACSACKGCFHMMRRDVRSHLVSESLEVPAGVPSARERLLRKRSDEPVPTLVFTEDEMATLNAIVSHVGSGKVNILY